MSKILIRSYFFSGQKLEVIRKHRNTFCPNTEDYSKNDAKRQVYTYLDDPRFHKYLDLINSYELRITQRYHIAYFTNKLCISFAIIITNIITQSTKSLNRTEFEVHKVKRLM